VHGLLITAYALVGSVEMSSSDAESSAPLEVAIAQVSPPQYRPIVRDSIPPTEVPTLVEPLVDAVEAIPKEPEPAPTEPLDPLLAEDPFVDLELDPLVEEEPIAAEEPEPISPPTVEEMPAELEPERRVLVSPLARLSRTDMARRLEGTVVLNMVADPSGKVVEVELISSSGHAALDRAAMKAAWGYRFEAGEGMYTAEQAFSFRLP